MPVGVSAFFLSQWAFQATRLSVSAPVLNIVDVLVAVGFGSAVVGDRLSRSPRQLVVDLAGATVIGMRLEVGEGGRAAPRAPRRERPSDDAPEPVKQPLSRPDTGRADGL